ncbi:hypothetical protein QTP70_030284 [Hemibagrus guttatus]|uniref:CCHC-type domain-containing protein n=1 Tax=Hemibagrus guttatus TaxID=175788 RepID=A0AAE0PZQ7_9TELE|nr:hypothetical protein QTP70_030284 [Hemibagrus guttatus]
MMSSLSAFTKHFKEVFGRPEGDSALGESLCRLKQGNLSVAEYALQFRTLAAASGWNEQALITTYRQGLNPRSQPAISTAAAQSGPVSHPEPPDDAMQLELSDVSSVKRQWERQRRLAQNCCFYCGSAGHFVAKCPLRPARAQRPRSSTLGQPGTSSPEPSAANSSSRLPPRLRSTKSTRWGHQCFKGCFPERPSPRSSRPHVLQVHTTSVQSPLEAHSVNIPACYSHFKDVFCPKKASKQPPHRPWDCAIDLIPGEPVPKGRIYSLTLPEEKAMEEYIREALAQGYIRPSTSPAASSFFFIAKKDGGLWPCIDYRALNKITVKFRYPLPLVPVALERLRGATVFTKLALRSAYNLIRIRKGDE